MDHKVTRSRGKHVEKHVLLGQNGESTSTNIYSVMIEPLKT